MLYANSVKNWPVNGCWTAESLIAVSVRTPSIGGPLVGSRSRYRTARVQAVSVRPPGMLRSPSWRERGCCARRTLAWTTRRSGRAYSRSRRTTSRVGPPAGDCLRHLRYGSRRVHSRPDRDPH